MNEDVAVARDREVALAPAIDLVEFGGIGDGEQLTSLPRTSSTCRDAHLLQHDTQKISEIKIFCQSGSRFPVRGSESVRGSGLVRGGVRVLVRGWFGVRSSGCWFGVRGLGSEFAFAVRFGGSRFTVLHGSRFVVSAVFSFCDAHAEP